ncbi:hypothetical protein Hdeb2414_s0009g00325271 [Helianthus debilis subsp. tardiflorus]
MKNERREKKTCHCIKLHVSVILPHLQSKSTPPHILLPFEFRSPERFSAKTLRPSHIPKTFSSLFPPVFSGHTPTPFRFTQLNGQHRLVVAYGGARRQERRKRERSRKTEEKESWSSRRRRRLRWCYVFRRFF